MFTNSISLTTHDKIQGILDGVVLRTVRASTPAFVALGCLRKNTDEEAGHREEEGGAGGGGGRS